MKKILLLILSLTLMSFALVGCGDSANDSVNEDASDDAQTIVITTEFGDIEVPLNPERVVVTDYGVLDILEELGLADAVVGLPKDSTLPEYLAKFESDDYKNVGSLKEYDFEAINALEPELIIIGGRGAESYDQLSKIAPTIIIRNDWTQEYMDFFPENLRTVASIFEAEDLADSYLADFEERINAINEIVTADESTALVTLLSSRTLKGLGPDARCSIISNEMGFDNLAIGLDESTHGDGISFEYILDLDPDYLFVLDRNAAIGETDFGTAEEIVENELIQNTSAYQNGNIVYLSPVEWYLVEGGLTSTGNMIAEIEAIFE